MSSRTMLPQIKALLIDLDGVVYRGSSPIPGAVEALSALETLGITHAFVTNNATLTPEEFVDKLGRMGISARPEQVVTSSEATADYLVSIGATGVRIYVLGEEGLAHILQRRGFTIAQDHAEFVVVGLDRHLTYERLANACWAVQAGARIVATNADPALPVEGGYAPGAGSILAALVTATRTQPTIIGKPEPTLLRVALDRLGVEPARAAIVGDQLETDIRAGRAAGITTILVSGGAPNVASDITPDVSARDLAEVLSMLRDARGAP